MVVGRFLVGGTGNILVLKIVENFTWIVSDGVDLRADLVACRLTEGVGDGDVERFGDGASYILLRVVDGFVGIVQRFKIVLLGCSICCRRVWAWIWPIIPQFVGP